MSEELYYIEGVGARYIFIQRIFSLFKKSLNTCYMGSKDIPKALID